MPPLLDRIQEAGSPERSGWLLPFYVPIAGRRRDPASYSPQAWAPLSVRSLAYVEAGFVLEAGRGGPDKHGVPAGGDGELVAVWIVVGQVGGAQAEQDDLALPGREVHLGVPLSCLGGSCAAEGETRYSSSVAGLGREEVFLTVATTVASPLTGW